MHQKNDFQIKIYEIKDIITGYGVKDNGGPILGEKSKMSPDKNATILPIKVHPVPIRTMSGHILNKAIAIFSLIFPVQSEDRIRCQGDAGLKLDIPAHIIQGQGACQRSALIGLFDVLVDVSPEPHIFLFIINTFLMDFRVCLFICPFFRRKIFLIVFPLREQVIFHCASINLVSLSNHFEACPFGIVGNKLVILFHPLFPESLTIICWSVLFKRRDLIFQISHKQMEVRADIKIFPFSSEKKGKYNPK